MRNAVPMLLLVGLVPGFVACAGDNFEAVPGSGNAGASASAGTTGSAGVAGDGRAGVGGGGASGVGGVGGRAGNAGSGGAGAAAGTSVGESGSGGTGDAGAAGTAGSGGDAGQAGESGAGQGGNAGQGQAGNAGAGQAGNAGAAQAGNGGAGQGGNAGASPGGAAGSGGGAAGSPGGSGGSPSGDCKILYVSPSGLDAADGCSPGAPKLHLADALERANVLAGVEEIHVCQGLFAEGPLNVDRALALRGGYDCDTFERATPLPPDKRTIITAKPDAEGPSTIRLGKAAVALDGFIVRGPLPPLAPPDTQPKRRALGAALSIVGGSAVEVRDVVARGARSITAGAIAGPTGGVEILDEATPRFIGCNIDGGNGTTDGTDVPALGSVGVVVWSSASRPRFETTNIDGGDGGGQSLGSVGMLFHDAKLVAENRLQGVDVTGGNGRSTGGSASVALFVLGGELEIDGAVFDGGTGSPAGIDAVSTVGIAASAGVKLRLQRTRVYGGDVRDEGTLPLTHGSVGVQGYSAAELSLENCIVHGGGSAAPKFSTRSSVALVLAGVTNSVVGFSTLVAGAGITGGPGIVVRADTSPPGDPVDSDSVTVEGSLLLTGNGVGLQHERSKKVPVLRGNAFAADLGVAACRDCGTASQVNVVVPADFAAPFPGSAENLILRAPIFDDIDDGRLPLCKGLAGCGGVLFENFGLPSDGKNGVFDRVLGYQLKEGLPCAFAKSFSGTSANPPNRDAFGSQRDANFSPGASERNKCTPP